MDRRSALVGFLAGGWVATLVAAGGLSPLSAARAQDAFPIPPPGGPQRPDPLDSTTPGRTVDPVGGSFSRGNPTPPGSGTTALNNRAIALSAPVGSGESVVYYFDTELQRLLVYQYQGGDFRSDRGGLRLLAARHIDYDLKLEEYRDRSEKTRDELKAAYDRAARTAPAGDELPELPVKKVDLSGAK
jgi:hypothetical protein